ncbi:hypothetical protein [Pseudomonas synxantha]|uniref:hypothetical protein n=1 Tax=Pseudomonas synxantha TaxID=47883 RepID=UPI000F575641|nr:hypothetical protein [Pseudomonas synxantha]AZE65620.1 hypothetical protein C4K01_1408 [Pseudomonas synxantha]
MSHNQTIDGVPRELLVRLCNFHAAGWEDIEPEIKELRALLDAKPVEVTGDDALALTVDHQQFIAGDHEDLIDNASDFQDRAYALGVARGIARGAMQPQGEPVAWHCVGDIGTEHVTLSQDCANSWFSHGGRSLPLVYAEHPAPVAVASLEIVGRQCFPSETMKKIPNYRTEPWVDGDVHQSPSVPGLYRVEPLVRLSDVTRLNTK